MWLPRMTVRRWMAVVVLGAIVSAYLVWRQHQPEFLIIIPDLLFVCALLAVANLLVMLTGIVRTGARGHVGPPPKAK
jgi:hypothetical protein